MPTIILLDTSLSMLRPASRTAQPTSQEPDKDVDVIEEPSPITLMDLAKGGLETFLDHLDKNFKLEFVSLIGYSSQCELICPFTRDIPELREKLKGVECSDATCVSVGIRGLVSYVQEQWANSVPVNIVLLTDEGVGNGPTSLSRVGYGTSDGDLFPFGFPGSLTVICLGRSDLSITKEAKAAYEKLIERTGMEGQVIIPEPTQGDVDQTAVNNMFQKFFNGRYKQFVGTLKFGEEQTSAVSLFPPPAPIKQTIDFQLVDAEVESVLQIKGFLSIADVSSPPVVSRHLVLPHIVREDGTVSNTDEESRTPSLCVFLHASLKVENLCALVQVASDKTSAVNWFGLLFSCADTKKKSNLMLALFEPGNTPVPWLGDLRRLGPLEDLNQTSNSPFPVRASQQKPSYTSSPVVWIREASLYSDIQKILRNARKLPEKTPHFYKELNRLKKAALALGFHDLLIGVASIFERECSLLPGSAHPDCAMQLSHAASELRSKNAFKFEFQIAPLGTKYPSKRD